MDGAGRTGGVLDIPESFGSDAIIPRMKLLLTAFPLLAAIAATAHAQTKPAFFRVTAAPSLPGPVSGRLLVFMKQGSGDKSVDTDEFHPEAVWIAAQEVHDLAPGA